MQRLFFLAAALAYSSTAHAFGEDLCYPPNNAPVVNCQPVPAACQPVPTATDDCKQAVIAQDANASSGIYVFGRSTVHVDSTFMIAQALGFSFEDAYWIAAYDGAVDNGQFWPYDNNSTIVGGGMYTTAQFSGTTRGDLTSGGVLLHFIAPYNGGSATPIANENGLTPNPQDATTEPTLANWRAWAVSGSAACTAGLTMKSANNDYGTGASCFPGAVTIHGSLSAIGNAAVPFNPSTGLQIVEDPSGGPQQLATQFAAIVATDGAQTTDANHLADARLGFYLHILADRITHHECTDRAVIAGPTLQGWTIDMTNDQCVSGWHFLHHAWETGVDFSLVPEADRTTQAALSIVWDELAKFAAARGLPPTSMTKAQLTASLATALEPVDPIARVTAVDAVGCAAGFTAFPGQPACPVVADTSSATGNDAGTVDGTSSSGGGCCSSSAGRGSWLLALGVLLALRRRR